MPLTLDQAKAFWVLFKDSPLFAGWPEAEYELPQQMDALWVKKGEAIFEKQDRPDYLYLVIQGEVQQALRRPRQTRPWLEKRSGPGRFFGQHSLLLGEHVSDAIALTETLVLRMSAADLRIALERSESLHEYLLPATRSGRLRGIPLLRVLTDDEIRWLSQLVAEESRSWGESLDLDLQPGLWIISHGLVEVTGPASRGQKGWRLTAGNFFFGPGVPRGSACSAESAVAQRKTELFYLPAIHAKRLLDGFTDIRKFADEPVDIAGILEKHAGEDESTAPKIFRGPRMTTDHFQHLAQYCAWEFVPSGLTITTQGSIGHSFVLLKDGGAIIIARDQKGRMRPQNYLSPITSYGGTSLTQGRERDATVRAVTAPGGSNGDGLSGAELIILDRRDLQIAFDERRDLWRSGVTLFDQISVVKREKQPFEWLDEGETVHWQGRGHIIWLWGPQILVWLGFLTVLGLTALVPQGGLDSGLAIALLVLAGIICVPLSLWILINYYDDYYVITNRRVTRRDRLLLLQESRVEAPIDMV